MVLKHVLPSEKTTFMIDKENKLQFIVDLRDNRAEIKREVEMVFETPVKSVRTLISPKGKKKAIIAFVDGGKAKEVATSLGIL